MVKIAAFARFHNNKFTKSPDFPVRLGDTRNVDVSAVDGGGALKFEISRFFFVLINLSDCGRFIL
jgi:hypothetical protein